MKEIFDNYMDNAFDGYKQSEAKIKQFERNYKKYFPKDLSLKVLDVGIGRGEMLTCMKNWGYENYLGVDISPSTVEFCTSLNLRSEVVESSDQYLLDHAGQFSVITLFDVLEHIPKNNVIAFVSALRTALTDDGVLLLQVPNLQAPDGYLHRYNDITHEIGFIEHTMAQVLMTAGFKKYQLFGLDDFVRGPAIDIPRGILRSLHWSWIRFTRMVDGNLNPKILHPTLCAAAFKN